MISITGEPYDTLQTVIGCNETESKSSLKEFGIKYEQIDDRDFCLENLKEKINWRTVENPV